MKIDKESHIKHLILFFYYYIKIGWVLLYSKTVLYMNIMWPIYHIIYVIILGSILLSSFPTLDHSVCKFSTQCSTDH